MASFFSRIALYTFCRAVSLLSLWTFLSAWTVLVGGEREKKGMMRRYIICMLVLLVSLLVDVAGFCVPAPGGGGGRLVRRPITMTRFPPMKTLFVTPESSNNADKEEFQDRYFEENNVQAYSGGGIEEYDPSERLPGTRREVNVGDPQIRLKKKERSVTSILKELAAIQQQGPQKYCILGTRHCSYLHQQIIELLAYALVLSGNHVYTSGAVGTNAATIRGALRAERPDLLTVVLPQSMEKQARESQELLKNVTDLITMPQNDGMSLDIASRICNSYILSQTDQLISFAFHESSTVIEATKEAKKLDMLVTTLYLD